MADAAHQDRLTAIRMLTSVVSDGKSLGELLRTKQQTLDSRDAARLQELTFGTIRWSYRLDAVVSRLLKKPLRNKDSDIRVLLWQALYEILYMRTPDYAVVNSYAALTKKLKKPWAKALINASLREFLRSQDKILVSVDEKDHVRHSLPLWIEQNVIDDWGELAEEVFNAGNQKSPLVLRVNQRACSRDAYLQQLTDNGINAATPALGRHSVVVVEGARVESLPGFGSGQFTVQDSAAQLAAELVNPVAGQRILDACAAPGGKASHLLEMCGDIELLAVDSDASRLQRVQENLQRLNLQAELKCADASAPQDWWDGRCFDSVLLDAPCSALGVLRRHPDIRQLRRESDIASLASIQRKMLSSLWETVNRGGRLVYATCSVLKSENEEAIAAFLHDTTDAVEVPIDASWGVTCAHGRQILPGQHDSDGFYYAILEKR